MANATNALLESRVYTSRLLGKNTSLVLHGGGNTSVKIREKNILGDEEDVLYVKGSGWDLETIAAEGFSPVRLCHLKKLATLDRLSDSAMVNELITHQTRSSAPIPSVEAILHAIIPYVYVDHTHADAVVAISNSVNGEAILRELYKETVIYVPYIMPGFDLSRLCAQIITDELDDRKIGMILFNHGVFSFGNTAEESYNRMIKLVAAAEDYLKSNAQLPAKTKHVDSTSPSAREFSLLRNQLSKAAGFPLILQCNRREKSHDFCRRPDVGTIAQQGPATPDHVIRTKRLPLIGRNVDEYVKEYERYFQENEPLARDRKVMLDPAPRVVLDPEFGVCAAGRTAKDVKIVADIYDHTIDIISWATALGGYKALPAKDIFDVEYWELEQAKLAKTGKLPPFTGEVALITGVASGIGKATADALLKRGAAVVGLDINPDVTALYKTPAYTGIICDVTSPGNIRSAVEQAVFQFGGIDMLVLNAGIFPKSSKIEELDISDWQKVMKINLDANFVLMHETHFFLKHAPAGGRIVIIGSKNVPAPGPGAAAYSASKAALNQLARVAALEWGKDRIRINSLHPNAVFDTGIWTGEVLTERAKHYGLTLEAYKTNNLLGTEIRSADVAELAAELCGPVFSKTTGAQIPVDGGNERVI